MPYILNKTNGTILTTLDDATLDVTTSLTFVGRNYSGYGEFQNENFLRLLENSSNTSPPTKPIQGQLWFDNSFDKRTLNVCFDGKNFKSVATLRAQENVPDSSTEGELWWDTLNNQLKAFDGSSYLLIGPQTSSSARSSWEYGEEIDLEDSSNFSNPIIKGKIGTDVIVTISKLSNPVVRPDGVYLKPRPSSGDLTGSTKFGNGIRRGITLVGCDANGSSRAANYYFWGTASDALRATTATNFSVTSTSTNATFYVPFLNSFNGGTQVFANSSFNINPSTGVLNATATSAFYADLAENFLADQVYPIGTVMVVGGEKEVTASQGGERAIGVVSDKPAYLMNQELKDGTAIALKGRVPVRIIGSVKKGQKLLAGPNGCAVVTDNSPDFFGLALEDSQANKDTVEAVIL